MVGILDMANYDLNNYLRQMDSFRAADHARENLVNVSYTIQARVHVRHLLTSAGTY
jgi:hypothetical protein